MGATGRIVIEELAPTTPSRAPAKAVSGHALPVSAVAFRDGHGIIATRLRWRPIGRDEWSVEPLRPTMDDRFVGSFVPIELGLHELVVDAWTARFETWRHHTRARLGVGEDVEAELLEGALLIRTLAPQLPVPTRRRVLDAAETLESTTCALSVRLDAGFDDAVAAELDPLVDPWDHTESESFFVRVERELAAIGAWYEFFPRSEGGLRRAAKRLDAIADMGFDVVYLPPVHPVGTTNRKGRNNTLTPAPGDPGSPWAIGSPAGGHTAVEPSLGTIADFDHFVARAAELGLEVALDYALQCSPDHPWITEHPEWFHHLPDGSLRYAENPPKKYQDIHPIDFWPAEPHRAALWDACHQILEFWISHGVRIFRVDNPHTKPVAFWEWLLAEVWAEHPDVVFLSEAFTHPAMMHKLGEVGFSQSYTYFTWRTHAAELRDYVTELAEGEAAAWFRPNFWPNTPDILAGPLRHGGRPQFESRAVLAALLAPSWGVYSGYELCENEPASQHNEEYHDSEKYRIVERDWSTPDTLAPLFTLLNGFRRRHPAATRLDTTRFHAVEDGGVLAWSRHDPDTDDRVLVVALVEADRIVETMVHLDLGALGLPDDASFDVVDELTGERWSWHGWSNFVRLDPAERVAHAFRIENH